MSDSAITMYSTNWCGDCHRAKAFLKAEGVTYNEVDIEQDERAAEIVMAHNDGKRRVPTFEIAGAYYGNPPISDLRKLVRAAATD